MLFRILGPLEVHRENGELVRLGSAKQRAVLAALLLDANHPVSTDRLADVVWGAAPPPTAAGALRTHVSALRQTLRLKADTLVAEPAGYRLRVAADDLDLMVFEELREAGEHALREGDPVAAAERLQRCVSLWRGRPFEDVPLDDGRLAGLEERRLAVTESLVRARLDLGQHAELAAELRRLVHERPLRERLWGHWMLALYRCGRQHEALAAFHTLRRLLGEELGVAPDRMVRVLHEQILAADPVLEPPRRGPVPRQLPPDVGGFTGRTEDVSRLTSDLGTKRQVIAIDGPGGIGKSALAVHVAHLVRERFPDGQLYAELHGATRPAAPLDVLGRFLRALGVAGADRFDLAEASGRFRAETATRRLLVVLDDASGAAQVRPLLPAGSGCAVLLTSRRVLATLDGAGHVHLAVLATAEATTLLGAVAGRARVAADPASARRIAELCGHLPLALRIAGARLAARPRWPVRALADRLGDARRRLDELQADDLGVRASLRVSHEALTRGELVDQAAAGMFGLLGLPDGEDLCLPVVARLFDVPEETAERVMERLVDAALVESGVPGRYRLHDLVRLFARELAGPCPEALTRAMRWQVARAWEAFRVLRPGDRRLETAGDWAGGDAFPSIDDALAWLELDRANLVATVVQAAATPGIPAAIPGQLARALFGYFHIRGYWADWVRVNRIALETGCRSGDRVAEAFAHRDLGAVHEIQGGFDAAVTHLRSALAIFTELGDRTGEASCLNGLGTVYDSRSEYAAAAGNVEQALEIARDLGDRHSQGIYLNNLGPLYGRLGRPTDAAKCLTEAKAIFTELGNRRSYAVCATNLGEVHESRARFTDALACHEEGLSIFEELADSVGQAHALTCLGRTHRGLGRTTEAVRCFEASLAVSERTGDRRATAETLRQLAETLHESGREREATANWRRALPILEELGVPAAAEVRQRLKP